MSLYPPAFNPQLLVRAFAQHADFPLGQILSADAVEQTCTKHGLNFGVIWNAYLVLFTWILQPLCSLSSCAKTLPATVLLLTLLHLPVCSANNGAFCKARAKISHDALRELALHIGHQLEHLCPTRWRWRGRRVFLADGTTVNADDTPENQAEFPQLSTQAKGLGFPILRLVVLIGLATAALLGCNFGPYEGKETGETALLLPLLEHLEPGDILLADRYYCSYWLIALTLLRGILICFRLHQLRKVDYPTGPGSKRQDFQAVWTKPVRPKWMTAEVYDRLPQTLTVRLIDYRVTIPGFRAERIQLATTLLDEADFSTADLADLYHRRWNIEVDIRNVKVTLGLSHLSCRSPEMVKAELWAKWYSYNVARLVGAQAAIQHDVHPRQIGFASLQSHLEKYAVTLGSTSDDTLWRSVVEQLWLGVTRVLVGNRPNRVEPRKRKGRASGKYENLRVPRGVEKESMLQKWQADLEAARQADLEAARRAAESEEQSGTGAGQQGGSKSPSS